jgi:Rieske 2Fe-2S family protein
LDGSLISAPNATALTAFDPSQFSLIPVHLEIWQGMVWINLSDHPTPLQEHVLPFILERLGTWEVFAAYPWEKLKTGKKISYTVEANWKLILENFLECYHCPHVHPELCRLLPGFRQGGSYLAGTGVGTQLADQVEAFSTSGRSHFPIFANLCPEDQRAYYGFVIYPNLMINLLPDQVVIHQAQPLSPTQTRVTCEWLFEERTVQDPEFDPADAVTIFDLINRQDWEVCELAQQGVGSRAFSQGGVYLPAESDLALFTQMIRECLQDLDGQEKT